MSTGCSNILVAAPQGRSGKTTLSLGICAALHRRGLRVQPFKKGPDYIDPSWLSAAAGRPCRTLDPFFQPGAENLRQAFSRGVVEADFALIEGNHGLYDSAAEDGSGSSAALARILKTPILLVVNAARMGRSVGAMVHGYQTFEPDTPIAGVVLNNVAGKRHQHKLRTAIEETCGLPVVGVLPRDQAVNIPDRHLGLIPNAEDEALHPAIEACRQAVEKFVDLEALLPIAGMSELPQFPTKQAPINNAEAPIIGVLRDRAFTFYYPENFEALERARAQLCFIDALHDRQLPDLDALYIGGGFPEIFLEELEANHSLRREINQAIQKGLPVYAECGGLMYLCEQIHWGDRSGEMVGALPLEVEVCSRPQGHGYVQAEVIHENPFWPVGTKIRGHEFHNSRLTELNGSPLGAYRMARGTGLGNGSDGLIHHNILASYTHIHADGVAGWAEGLVAKAKQYAEERAYG